MAIIEICSIDAELGEKITSKAPYSELKAGALKGGMVPLRSYGWTKVLAGLTTIEEVLTNVEH